jgi:hypothetical protein
MPASFRRTWSRGLPWAAALGLALIVAPVVANDWTSPSPSALPPAKRAPSAPQDAPQAPPWAGLMWAGPSSGPPAVPSANTCARPPQRFEVDGPPGAQDQFHGRIRPLAGSAGAARSEDRARLSSRSADLLSKAAPAAPVAGAAPAAAAPRLASPGFMPTPVPPVQPSVQPRPASEAVSAGVIDDNADFGEYLAYRARWGHLPKRELAVEARVRLDVRDGQGRPVPDATVSVFAAGRAQPLWARTDAGGHAWLMPQADMAGDVFEVQISKAGASTRVLWQRGQKDGLQARLDGTPLRPARLDLAFLVDATGSMGDEIDKLKRSMKAMADQIAQLPSRPDLCLALVAYRDRGDAFFIRGADFSNDLAGFQAALAQLQAAGGGDNPEAMNEALHTAVHRLSWRGEGTARMVVLVADAPPHLDYGAPQYDDDLRGALARGIKVFSVGASGLDPQGEYIMRQAAQFTGGRFVFLTYAEAARPSSGPGRETVHDVRNYSVETLDKLVVRLVSEELAQWPGKP